MTAMLRRQLVPLVFVGLLMFGACKPAGSLGDGGKGNAEVVVAQAKSPAAAPSAYTVPVVVAAVDLPIGTLIRDPEKMLQIKPFLADSAPVDGLRNLEDLRNKTLGRNIAKGEPITLNDFSEHSSIFRPAPPGYRAMSLKLDPEGSVSGFVLPGSRVDVVAAGVKDGKPAARMVLQNVLVLAVTTSVFLPDGSKNKEDRDRSPLITLAVKPLDGLNLAEAQAAPNTKILLMLRRPGEDEEIRVPGEKP